MLPAESSWGEIPDSTLMTIGDQTVPHILWRNAFFKAVGEAPSSNNLLTKAHALAAAKGTKKEKNVLKKTTKKSPKKSTKSRKPILGKKKENRPEENNKKGKGKTETTSRRRRKSVLKKPANKKAKESAATPSNTGKARKGRKGNMLNAEKRKAVKKEEL